MKIAQWPAAKVSRCCFYLLIGVSAVVYVLFFLVGYATPYEADPSFSAPLFTPLLIAFVELLGVGAVGTAVWMAVRQHRASTHERVVNGVPQRRISVAVASGVAVLALVTLALGSSQPLAVHGTRYVSALSLRVADMFIATGSVLIVVAVAAVIYSGVHCRVHRKER